jgi:D-threo-aldose 1-dehydrogenase
MIPAELHRELGRAGLRIPPLAFSAAPLANACRVTPEQTRIAICVEWFKHTRPAVVDVTDRYDAGRALAILGQVARRAGTAAEELVICRRIREERVRHVGAAAALYDSVQLLSGEFDIGLVAIDGLDEHLAAQTVNERNRQRRDVQATLVSLIELRDAGRVRGVGIGLKNWRVIGELIDDVPVDWITLESAPTLLRQPPELIEVLKNLAERGISVMVSSTFHGGFLAGGSRFDGVSIDPSQPSHQKLLAWRKSFAALCHGHGLTPAAACVQFTLAAPGVAAVVVNTSRADRVAALVEVAAGQVPPAFWAALREEGLIDARFPIGS